MTLSMFGLRRSMKFGRRRDEGSERSIADDSALSRSGDLSKATVAVALRALLHRPPHSDDELRALVDGRTVCRALLVCRDVFANAGFTRQGDVWSRDLSQALPAVPPHITLAMDTEVRHL